MKKSLYIVVIGCGRLGSILADDLSQQAHWDSPALVLIVLILIGGSTGGTGGGIKQYRLYALYRGVIWEVRRQLLPRDAVTEPDIWQGEPQQFLSDRILRQISI